MYPHQCKDCKDRFPTNRFLEFIKSMEWKDGLVQEWRCYRCGEIIYKYIPNSGKPTILEAKEMEKVE